MASNEELEKKIERLEARLQELEDIEEIKKLQRAYGYYLEHRMADRKKRFTHRVLSAPSISRIQRPAEGQ